MPQLTEAFTHALGSQEGTSWRLELAEDDPAAQTILFHYPTGLVSQRAGGTYIQPSVRLEIGARSDQWPSREANIISYAAEVFPEHFTAPSCQVRVLSAERTFWEKVTLWHMWYHAPEGKTFRDRQSRHYYDVVRLYEQHWGQAAIKDLELLRKVAEHKAVFYPAAWARYTEARPGTLRILPPDTRLPELQRDYQQMQQMIFGSPPSFARLLEVLAQIEQDVNRSDD
jgi:hypothetical protein